MLSKTHMLTLGIIKEAPNNPYEILRLFNELNVKRWMPYAESSIYASINALVKKGCITGVARRDGRMPEKSVYSITSKGATAFEEALRAYFLDTSSDYVQFTVAMLFICHLSKDEVLGLISQRLSDLEKSQERLCQHIDSMEADRRVPSMSVMTAKHHLYFVDASIKTTRELVQEVRQTTLWETFLSKELI